MDTPPVDAVAFLERMARDLQRFSERPATHDEASRLEWRLWFSALNYIANGHTEAEKIANIALKSTDLTFKRTSIEAYPGVTQ